MVIDVVTLQVLPEDLPELVCRQNGLRGWLVRRGKSFQSARRGLNISFELPLALVSTE